MSMVELFAQNVKENTTPEDLAYHIAYLALTLVGLGLIWWLQGFWTAVAVLLILIAFSMRATRVEDTITNIAIVMQAQKEGQKDGDA